MAQDPQGWIDLKLPFRDETRRRELDFRTNDDPPPWPLKVLRILGFGLLLAYPVITFVASAEMGTPYSFLGPFLGSAAVCVGLMCLGAGYRAGGSVLRGGTAGAAVYLLLSAVFIAYITLRSGPPPDLISAAFVGVGWPVIGGLLVLGRFG